MAATSSPASDSEYPGLQPCRYPQLIQLLRSEAEAVGEEMIRSIASDVPLYGSLDPPLLEDARRIGVVGFHAILGLWSEGRLAQRRELAPYAEMGVDRAQ